MPFVVRLYDRWRGNSLMKVVPLEKTKLTLPEVAELAKDGPVILTRNGKPLASIKNLSGSDWEAVALASNPRFRALIEESRLSYRKEGGISLGELRKQLGLEAKTAVSQTRRKTKT